MFFNTRNIEKFKYIIFGQLVVFLVLLALGVTGSSLGFSKSYGDFFSIDDHLIVGKYVDIRSDEWAVDTPLAIAQFNAQKDYSGNNNYQQNSFPLKNKKLGVTGKYASVIHDTGAPVKELALISKPAAFGFFIFDLRRALAWYWLIPIFISINGVFFLLEFLFKNQTSVNFILSLCLTFSYHSAAWSFWPAYQIGLGALATVFFLKIFEKDQISYKLYFSILCGIFTPAFILTLYLPRIIPIATLCLVIIIAYFIKNKNNIFYNWKSSLIGVFVTAIITTTIMASWYLNNQEAIEAITNSTYPGLRRTYYAGRNLWNEFSGWLNPLLLRKNFEFGNLCENSTYPSFIMPITYLLFCLRKKLDSIIIALIIFLVFNYIYLYIGIPEIIGKITFWNRTTSRAIIGIDFVQIIIFAWLYFNRQKIETNSNSKLNIFALAICFLFVIIALVISTPSQIYESSNFKTKYVLLCLIFLFITYYVFIKNNRYFPITFCFTLLYSTLLLHPLSIAPKEISSNIPDKVQKLIKNEEEMKFNGKFLVATGDHIRPNIVAALGYPIINSTSHYVDKDIYRIFYSNLDNNQLYNKFNHMIVKITDKSSEKIDSFGDVIQLYLPGASFNFSKFKADLLMVKDDKLNTELKKNPCLIFIEKENGFAYYKIKH